MGRSGVEMEGGQFRSEESLSKDSEIRKGRAHLKKDRRSGKRESVRVNVDDCGM